MQKLKQGLVWFFSVALAAGMAYSGIAKFMDPEGWGRRFEAFGVSSELLLFTAVFEVIGAALLLIPRLASYGAAIILVIMSVAVWSHLNSGVGDPTTAAVYAVVALVLLLLRLRQSWRPNFLHTDS